MPQAFFNDHTPPSLLLPLLLTPILNRWGLLVISHYILFGQLNSGKFTPLPYGFVTKGPIFEEVRRGRASYNTTDDCD